MGWEWEEENAFEKEKRKPKWREKFPYFKYFF